MSREAYEKLLKSLLGGDLEYLGKILIPMLCLT